MKDTLTILSGGQTGADAAALRAAKRCGYKTGGWAPLGWQTEDGPAPWLAEYGLRECLRPGYPARTFANVRMANLCILLYAERQANSPGTSLTRNACRQQGVECFEIEFYLVGFGEHVGIGNWRCGELRPLAAVGSIQRAKPAAVLVAGNRESVAPGIGAAAEAVLVEVLTALLTERT